MRIGILLLFAVSAIAEDRIVYFSSPKYFLPTPKELVFTEAGTPAPGDRGYAPLATMLTLDSKPKLNSEGPFDIWYIPKDGKAIKAVAGFKVKEGNSTIELNKYLGVISFRGEGQPRGTLLVTPEGDDGPETKKHVVIQTAGDTRAEVAVLPGDYAVWVVPANGARARRVADKVRVLAGKTATVE